MASEKFLSRIGKALGNAFSSTGDDAIRAVKKIVSNADDDIFDFIKNSDIDLEDIFKKDSSFLGRSTNMMHYIGEGVEEGGTALFSDKDNFRKFLSSNYSDDISKNFDNFVSKKNAVKNILKEGNSSPFYSSLNRGIPDNPIGKAILQKMPIESEVSDIIENQDYQKEIKRMFSQAEKNNVGTVNSSGIDRTMPIEIPTNNASGINERIRNEISEQEVNTVRGNSAPVVDSVGTHKQLKKARYGSMPEYKMFKESDRLEEGITAYNKKQYDNPILKEATEYINKIEETNLSPHELTKEQLNAYRNFSIGDSKTAEATFKDKLGYNQIPQKVTGVMSTAWLVNNLASRKGQQTNSELYNQQQQNQGYY